MDEDRPRRRPLEAQVSKLSPTRAELVRYFAWGYLSRRELNEHLRALSHQQGDAAA
jgi:hypothetical protein